MSQDLSQYTHLLPQNLSKLAFNLSVRPHWLNGDGFWYCRDLRLTNDERAKEFLLVDAQTGEAKPAFNHARLAKQLKTTPDNLPFDEIEFFADEMIPDDYKEMRFMVANRRYSLDLATYKVTLVRGFKPVLDHGVLSPDGKWVAFLRGNNLFVQSRESGEVRAVTRDGKKDYNYATRPDFYGTKTLDEIHGNKPRAAIMWSPDSTRILTHRLDQRKVRRLPVMQYAPEGEYAPAKVRMVRYPLAGDENITLVEHLILGLDGTRVNIQEPPLELRNTDALMGPFWENIWWSEDGNFAYYVHPTRGCKTMQFCAINTLTGEVRVVLEEHSDTFLDQDMRLHRGPKPDVRVLPMHNAFIWASQKDGWYHLYLHDLTSGEVIHPLTTGNWLVTELFGVDEAEEWVYFLGSGQESNRDPYLQHLYRVRLDGSDLTNLTPEDAEHSVHVSPDFKVFVDTYSRVDVPPVSLLRRNDGALLARLEVADVEPLLAAGYQMPEPFAVKAADGETDLYGILIRPAGLNEGEKYPVVEYEYGGPQTYITPKAFTVSRTWDAAVYAQILAQLGFASVIMDGRGTAGRSKKFHDFSAGDLGAAASLVDHPAGLRQLAERFPFLDLSRVGMYGFSGGGYGSARALLTYSDFYKVAVAACGNHDNRLYDTTWWDRYMGTGRFDQFPPQDNQSLAPNLEGKLLLMHGDIDDNVHPNNTMRLVDALIRADKDVDMLLLPNRGHPLSRDPYVARRVCSYFTQYL